MNLGLWALGPGQKRAVRHQATDNGRQATARSQ